MFKHVSVLSTLAISLLLPFQSVSAVQANKKLVNYDDILNIEHAASPQVSPDGDYVIYERRAMDIMTDGSRIRLILMVRSMSLYFQVKRVTVCHDFHLMVNV